MTVRTRPTTGRTRPTTGRTRRYDRWKRIADVVTAACLLVVLAPMMLVVALLVRAVDGGPALYRQRRPGLHGVGFDILKFRSMRPDRELEHRGADADHLRITPLGRVLRATSIDELPNLVNVLRGEMSIVGPRPHLMSYLDLYSPHQARRHEVRPGITGLAQVRGRNALDWPTRLDLDVQYVDERSLVLDLRILAATVVTVFARHGVSAPGHATMAHFQGNTEPAPQPAEASLVG
jgi:lipopolysaccharide/colanic/teichoic acid biosynthesis glycosyltransferase